MSRQISKEISALPKWGWSIATANTPLCPKCLFRRTDAIIEMARGVEKRGICKQCTEADIQTKKASWKNSLLAGKYKEQVSLATPIIERQYNISVNLTTFLQSELNTEDAEHIIQLMPKEVLSVRVLHLKEYTKPEDFNRLTNKLGGAHWNMASAGAHPNTVGHDHKYDATIILFPMRVRQKAHDQNFAIMMSTNFEKDMVDAFSNIEMTTSINRCETASRTGAAAGVTELKHRSDCKSFTRVTKKDTSLLLSSSEKGVNMTMMYYNNDGVVKHAKWGYKHLLMKRLSKQGKIGEATKYTSFQHILVSEAICYIAGVACVDAVGIPPPICCGCSRLRNLKNVLDTNQNETIHIRLIKWMCTTGEMRNHQAVACHVDGNKCHPYEIYSLFRRSGAKIRDGYIYLPLDNIVLQLVCDTQMMICNFKQAPHVPDESRNTHNFSKVHGPDP